MKTSRLESLSKKSPLLASFLVLGLCLAVILALAFLGLVVIGVFIMVV
ncbi:MAG: hypothetical protein AAFY88_28490 [Acidobacteriota bacterium]